MERYFVYILASSDNGTLYIGITSNLIKRVYEHKNKIIKGFTAKYNVTKLVYFESSSDALGAISREKRLKTWQRQWKVDLITKHNPDWFDLYPEICM